MILTRCHFRNDQIAKMLLGEILLNQLYFRIS